MTSISQKEYLKKYLGIGKAPGEKRKKKKKITGSRLDSRYLLFAKSAILSFLGFRSSTTMQMQIYPLT
jgi:hypothetical protein